MVDWNGLVGKRVLVRDTMSYRIAREAKVLEVAPKGEYVKQMVGGKMSLPDFSG